MKMRWALHRRGGTGYRAIGSRQRALSGGRSFGDLRAGLLVGRAVIVEPKQVAQSLVFKLCGLFLWKIEKPQGRKCTLRLEREIAN